MTLADVVVRVASDCVRFPRIRHELSFYWYLCKHFQGNEMSVKPVTRETSATVRLVVV